VAAAFGDLAAKDASVGVGVGVGDWQRKKGERMSMQWEIDMNNYR
jgi:hypothetical protein